MEIFSDAVIAIAMTIMVLELKTPHGTDWHALAPLMPVFLSYILSYVYLGIYWNNHHHLLHATDHIDGRIMWANLHLLFWLSLIPFTTAWMAENHFAAFPTGLYGAVLLFAGVAYYILSQTIVAHGDANHALREVLGKDKKGLISVALYLFSFVCLQFSVAAAFAIYILVALMWLVPDRRIEKKLGHRSRE